MNNRLLPKSGKIIPFDLFYSFLFKKNRCQEMLKEREKKLAYILPDYNFNV